MDTPFVRTFARTTIVAAATALIALSLAGPASAAPFVQSPDNCVSAGPFGCIDPGTIGSAGSPKQGPTVSWDPVLGGLVAHITDRSGVSSQCTYTSDFYTRGFGLAAGSRFDLKIVPAIPEFRNWDVNINCDNGTSTHTSEFF